MISVNINGNDIEIIPEVLFLYEDPRRVEPVVTNRLMYPVVGTAMIKYKNALNIKYARPHNIYINDDNYFIDVLNNTIILDDIDKYSIKYPESTANRYTVYGKLKFNTDMK